MPAAYRTTVSLTFWTDTPEAATDFVDSITDQLPPEDQPSVIASTEYMADGRPDADAGGELPPAEEES
jgi:hypothetical protein